MGECQNRKNTLVLPFMATTSIFFLLTVPLAAPLTFNYSQFLQKDDNLILEGEVYQENGVLQLTEYKKDSAGRVTHNQHMHLWDKASGKLTDFTTHFSFIINATNNSHLGDGITFFMAGPNFPLPMPPDGSGIGLVGRREMQDSNYKTEHPFVAVEFDTFPNDWDPPYDHVGVIINSMKSTLVTEWYSIKDGRKYGVEISYNSSSTRLSVIFTGYKDNVTIKQEHHHLVDLKEHLPERVQFGFSSATGLFYEIHTLCSWSFNSSLELEVPKDKSKSRLVMWLSIGVGVLVIGLGLLSFVMWKKRRGGSHDLDFELTMDHGFERGNRSQKFSLIEQRHQEGG